MSGTILADWQDASHYREESLVVQEFNIGKGQSLITLECIQGAE
jgi:hypothetical protein